jgi:hypothetical protein
MMAALMATPTLDSFGEEEQIKETDKVPNLQTLVGADGGKVSLKLGDYQKKIVVIKDKKLTA